MSIGVITGMLKLLWLYVLAHKARPDIEKALTQSQFANEEQQIYLNLWSVDILSMSAEQISQPNMQICCLLGLRNILRIFANRCET